LSELLPGINSVAEALKSGRDISTIYVVKGKVDSRISHILQMAEEMNIQVRRMDKANLDRLAGSGTHQGVVAEAESFLYYSLTDILDEAEKRGEQPLVVLLDGIMDPQNLGAIIRSAECLGAHGVVIPKHGACEVTPAVVRASAGAVEHLKVARVTNLVNAINELKKRGVWIVGSDVQGSDSCFDLVFPESVAIVVGSEGRGIRRLVRENCDFMVHIPMKGRVNSLNASVSCAVIMAQIARQRGEAAEV